MSTSFGNFGDFLKLTDEQLLSAALSPIVTTNDGSSVFHSGANVEMLRRLKSSNGDLRNGLAGVVAAIEDLKGSLETEERAIKRLTRWLVGLTVTLVVMTGVLVWQTQTILRHDGVSVGHGNSRPPT